MGASGWSYRRPFTGDVDAALRALREDVFARADYYRLDPEASPGSIEEALKLNGEAGTHSILDVFNVSPVPDGILLEQLGTTRPRRRALEANPGALDALIVSWPPWSGAYFVLHDDGGTPVEYVFVGRSGD